ncbi:hypothetical protein LOTGIDRAFT_232506 [Lottia gigantea]|uniref:Uncharacterized protein n=1 Tax=Lottia gigantea TaxID=225164 RepID=V4BYP5_LOTGI|nr:hypothetical protein LOTGIDRAFT_232506 [Lottia gigantea]ESO94264.1 hypothetical protein LOTGIDRAFT_232506 [Lottia gigantea]
MRNTNRTLKRFDDILCPKGRLPRSVSQIKNNVFAQQKLLGRPVTASGTDMDPEMNRSVISRSRTLLRSKSDLGGVPESSHCSSAGITQTGQSMFNPLSHRTFDKIQNISTKLSYLQESKLEMRAKETRALLAKENFVRRLKQIQDSGEDTEDLVDVCEFGSVPVAWDEEVTDSQLCSLERKLKEFCSVISKDDHKPNSIQIQNFKRFNIQNSSDIPQPGGTVLVECRPCLQTLDNVQLTNHSHTHHYILNK